jgi:hypothetical protein
MKMRVALARSFFGHTLFFESEMNETNSSKENGSLMEGIDRLSLIAHRSSITHQCLNAR